MENIVGNWNLGVIFNKEQFNGFESNEFIGYFMEKLELCLFNKPMGIKTKKLIKCPS